MSELAARYARFGVAAIAVVVMVLGLLPDSAEAGPAVREQRLSERIACPWCHGQSLAESDSQVARDLIVILREKIDSGWSDDQIYNYFASSYGDHVLLEPPLTGWGVALWLLPIAALGAGAWVIWGRQRGVE